ncbi:MULTISPECIES: sensor histidine kinase [Ramlibacter]|uniref:histidine kinase n=1 Tax=Ramlibacter aquaticus TaxID=2780094 RepID=A0ABR9SGD2_9BURK|nr:MULTISPECIES: sensor histidine kinase [Ramlibacter]MBE7941401.1 sensor histidine kinase [Ramlibacter aquaticus]
MKAPASIRARLALAAAAVLALFLAVAGFVLQRAHADSVVAAHHGRLQATVYLLLGAAEVDAAGQLQMPAALAEPRLSQPGSGLYAAIRTPGGQLLWRSASAPPGLPFPGVEAVGQWALGEEEGGGRRFLSASYEVNWLAAGDRTVPLVLSVLEDESALGRELAAFERTLWGGLAAAALLLLLSQALLVRWSLAPLERVAAEIGRIDAGEQARVEGQYPPEIEQLTQRLNALVERERARQKRWREAVSFLAHSLKTPLAVLRATQDDPAQLREAVVREVARMDDIVQHQLARAAAATEAATAPPLALRAVAERIAASLRKVHAERGLVLEIEADAKLAWPLQEGDAFEILGNLMDNACKWARQRVRTTLQREAGGLRIRVEDDGPGFSDTEAVRRLHVRGDERVPGHGVGLAVVDELVGAQGGTLSLGRGALGGARVDVLLPG